MDSAIFNFFFSLAPSQLLGTAINVAICLLGVMAVVQIFHASRATAREHSQVLAMRRQLGSGSGREAILSLASQAGESSLLRERLELMRDLHAGGSDVENEALTALSVASLDAQASSARWIASTEVLLGLGGTLIGLSQAVIRAQPMLANIMTGPEAVQAVIGTFSGLGTAFSTTLMGIIWAVGLGAALAKLKRRQARLLRDLELLSLTRLAPQFRTSPAQAMVTAATKLGELEARIGVALTELVGQLRTHGLAIAKLIEDSFAEVVTTMASTGHSLNSTISTSLSGLISEIQSRGVALTTTIDGSFSALTSELRDQGRDILDKFSATQAAAESLLGRRGTDAPSLAATLADLQQGVNAMKAASEQIHRTGLTIEEVIARQVDRQSRDIHESLHSYTGNLSASLRDLRGVLDDGIGRVREGLGQFGDVLLEQLRERDAEVFGSLEARADGIRDSLAGMSVAVERLHAATDQMADASNRVASMNGDGNDARAQAAAGAAEAAASLRAIIGQLDEIRRSIVESRTPPLGQPVEWRSPSSISRAEMSPGEPRPSVSEFSAEPEANQPETAKPTVLVIDRSARSESPPNEPSPTGGTNPSSELKPGAKRRGLFSRLFGGDS